MFNEVLSLLKGDELKAAMNTLVGCTQLLEMMNPNIIQDKNARNALIETIKQILDQHKAQ